MNYLREFELTKRWVIVAYKKFVCKANFNIIEKPDKTLVTEVDTAVEDYLVNEIKKMGLRVILATNPLFPSIATEKRIAWAGFTPESFEFFTTYENSSFSKPSLGYYEEVARKAGLSFNACLMVGNDVSDDMVAEKLGMKVFLLTDHLINRENKDISVYPRGNFEDLLDYVRTL